MNLEYIFYDPQRKEYQKSDTDIEKYIANLNLPTAKTYAALALTNKKNLNILNGWYCLSSK